MLESVLLSRDLWLKESGIMWPSTASIHMVPCSAEKEYSTKVLFWDSAYGLDFKMLKYVCLFVWLYAPLRFFPTNLSTLCMNYLPKTYNNWLTILLKYKCFVLGLFHMNVRILTSVFSAARDAQVFPYRNVQATCWYQWQATGQRDLHESPHVVCLHIRPSLRCPRRCVCGGPCSQLPVIDFNRLPAGLGMEKPADLSVYLCTPHGRANLETDC